MRKTGTYTVYSEKTRLAQKESRWVNTHILYTHIQKLETHVAPPFPRFISPFSHSAMHFIYNKLFLWGIHLSELFSLHFCHIALSAPSWSFSPFLYLKAKSSQNKTNKYQITYIRSCICQRLLKSKPAHCCCLLQNMKTRGWFVLRVDLRSSFCGPWIIYLP